MSGPFRRLARRLVAGAISDEPSESFWRSTGVSPPTASGVAVNDQTALRVTAVLSSVKVLAESISTLPLMVLEREANGDKRPAYEHPLTPILHTLANEESTAQSVRETHSGRIPRPFPLDGGLLGFEELVTPRAVEVRRILARGSCECTRVKPHPPEVNRPGNGP